MDELNNIKSNSRLLVCTPIFPNIREKHAGAFVQKLVAEFLTTHSVVDVCIIGNLFKKVKQPIKFDRRVKFKLMNIPGFSFLNKIAFFSWIRYIYSYTRVRFSFNFISENKYDVIYGKFLLSGGCLAYLIHKTYGLPYFLDLGESVLLGDLKTDFEKRLAQKIISGASGIVCLSSRLHSEAKILGADQNKILLSPNVASNSFYPLDKNQARSELGLNLQKNIVIFVGNFNHRKGPDRVKAALDILGENFIGVFAGAGELKPVGPNILIAEIIPNDKLNLWLNAADVFVLPSLAEGSCNAVHEAIACGLPVVISDIEDMSEFRNSEKVYFVDPNSPEKIAQSILVAVSEMNKRIINFPKENNVNSRGVEISEWMARVKMKLIQ